MEKVHEDYGQISTGILDNSSELTLKKAQERAEIEVTLAKGRVDSLLMLREAEEAYLTAVAGAIEIRNAAENTLSPEIIQMRLKMAFINKLPELVKASGKTIEQLLPYMKDILS